MSLHNMPGEQRGATVVVILVREQEPEKRHSVVPTLHTTFDPPGW